MYESHFGFTAAPFRLSPDPRLLFEGAGHARGLAYLRFGVYQGEGFIVLTGEVGTGKTTLVRALVEELDPERVVAAHIVSTQLDAHDLLAAIATAFGVDCEGATKGRTIAALQAWFTELAAARRRPLLIVDEAHNLGPKEVEELRMLSNFQCGSHALLQTFLVGQPELRRTLQLRSMEQFRQRVIAACHLGPLSEGETAGYVEHRLRLVGWTGRPAFDAGSMSEIYRYTGGVPRRVNVLCNRVLLAAYMSPKPRVERVDVVTAGDELRTELAAVA